MSNTIPQSLTLVQEEANAIEYFLHRFRVSELLRKCNAYKAKGYSVISIFTYLLGLMFTPISTYMSMRIGSYREPFSKNTIRRFCNDPSINWRKFLRLLALRVAKEFIEPATSDARENFLIFDDTPLPKFGKKTELVSKFFNHVNMKYMFGFRILTMVWTDGYSSIPVDFIPLASSNERLVKTPARKCDGRSIAGQNRALAQMPAPELIKIMIRNVLSAGLKVNYVLFDSWFSTPKGIMDIKREFGLNVIAMVKKSGKVFYEYGDEQLNVKQIFSRNKKKPGKSKYLLSINVNILQKKNGVVIERLPAKIVYVRNHSNKKDWVAIICTDTELSEEEIIRRYGYRWNIEQLFKVCKQYLKYSKECNSPSFDAFISHLALVYTRYMMLVVYQRSNSDERSLGELFYMYAAEVEEISFSHALQLIYTALIESVLEVFTPTNEQIAAFVSAFMAKLPLWLREALQKHSPQAELA